MPQAICGPENITIEGTTEELFEGVVFIKNWRRENGCAAVYSLSENMTTPSLSIPLNRIAQCGLELRRNSETKEVEVFVVFVFSFHPNFVTADDRSFAVHCIFQQQSFKVATKFNFIQEMNTRDIITGMADLPIVNLTVVQGRVPDPNMKPAKLVSVGDPLMYIWHLNSKTGIYGIWVKECSVEAEDGRKIKIIEDGCSLDPFIVSHVQYPENNLKAFADGLAFKFPDVDEVWISCAVTTCLRKFDQFIITNNTDYLCPKQSDCSKRIARSVEKEKKNIEIYSTDNLVHHKLHVIDQPTHSLPYRNMEEEALRLSDGICVDKKFFAGTFAALTTVYLATITVAGAFGLSIYRSQRKQ
ncbi:Cuticlin-1 [Dirofilaria immitis]|nr:Cuticlin-1 [Dirofilaria immitis]